MPGGIIDSFSNFLNHGTYCFNINRLCEIYSQAEVSELLPDWKDQRMQKKK
jgi:hypothetical protein